MNKLATIILASLALGLTGCATTGTTVSSILTPAKIAQGTTDVLSAVGAAVLANNPSYTGEVQAAADVFAALAASNPGALTGADVTNALSKSTIPSATQKAISAGAVLALGIYERDFAANQPTLKPDYAMFATAIANGLLGALGKPPLPLPPALTVPAGT